MDGRALDPTGRGFDDLRKRIFRFYPPTVKEVPLHNTGRFVRDLVRLPRFQRDRDTIELLRRSLSISTKSEKERKALHQAFKACRGNSELADFVSLIGYFRRDLRNLHRGKEDKLSPCFPLSLFLFDLFKSVTQAPTIEDMREVFQSLGVDRALKEIGLAREAELFMDRSLTRDQLFDALQFPGHIRPIKDENYKQICQRTLRRYTYRTLFDMLTSEFPKDSDEARLLQRRKDAFLKPSTWNLLRPDDNFTEQFELYLDVDFTLGLLPEEKIQKSLRWFLDTYLPLGPQLLVPLAKRKTGPSRELLLQIQRGYSPEVAQIDRNGPHSIADLDSYLGFQIGQELVELYLDQRASFAFLRQDEDKAHQLLQALGMEHVFRINAPGFSRRKGALLGWSKRGDRACFAFYDFHSHTQMINHQARTYFCLAARGLPPKRDRIYVVPSKSDGFPGEDHWKRFLDDLKHPVYALFVNFTNPLKQILNDVKYNQFGQLKFLSGTIPGTKRYCLAMSGFGACYGTLPAKIASQLLPRGLKAIVMVGTGGAVQGVDQRHQWVLPTKTGLLAHNEIKDTRNFPNKALLLALPQTVNEAYHITVPTPLTETRALMRKMRDKGVTSVDCEAHYLTEIARKHGLDYYLLINITDFALLDDKVNTPKGAIDVGNSLNQYDIVQRALKCTVEHLAK